MSKNYSQTRHYPQILMFQSDNPDNEKTNFDIDNQGNDNGTREYVSSPGYDTSSTHPPSSPDLCEYTYEGAIQDYKSRVSRAQKSGFTNNSYADNNYPKDSNHESNGQTPRKQTSAEIENRLSNFVTKTPNDAEKNENFIKKDLPKVDIARRRELFEKDKVLLDKKPDATEKAINNLACDFSQTLTIKERLMSLENRNDSQETAGPRVDCVNPEFGRVKDRLLDIENASINQNNVQPDKHTAPIDVPVISLKDRLSILHEVAPPHADEIVNENNLVISTEMTSSAAEIDKINNENINNNNNSNSNPHNSSNGSELMEEHFSEVVETKAIEDIRETETVDEPPSVPDVVIEEQPNRLLSTINEAIHLVVDQPENDVVKRDASVSSPNSFKNHTLNDIVVVDNDVNDDDIDDISYTNPKSLLLVTDSSTSENIVHNSFTTDDTTGNNQILTSAGESLCIDGSATFSDCCVQQSINDEISNKEVDVMYLRSPNVESDTLSTLDNESNSINETVKLVEPSSEPTRNGEIKLNFVEVHPIEDTRNVSPLNEVVASTGHEQNDSLVRTITNETKSIQTESSTTPVEMPIDSIDSPFITKESSESKNNRLKCQIVGVLEKHKCPNENTQAPSRSDLTINTALSPSASDQPLHSPSKSPYKSPKGIFDFIKRNLLIDPLPPAKDTVHSNNSNEVHSTFYIPLITTRNDDSNKGPSNSCSDGETVDESTEINILIDEELQKLD